MNIKLRKEDFEIVGTDEYGKFFIVRDKIGFSTENGRKGFNRADAGQDDGEGGTYPVYSDSVGNPYPKISEAVLDFLPFVNEYHKKDITLVDLNTSIEREEPSVEAQSSERIVYDYESEVAYNHEIAVPKNGWFTVYAFLIGAINLAEGDIPPNEGVYYDKNTKLYVDAITQENLTLADMLDRGDVESVELQFFQTPGNERKLHDIISKMADVAIIEGNCSKEYKRQRSAMLYYSGQLSGAHVKFNDGYQHRAQQIIEDLENSNPYEDC